MLILSYSGYPYTSSAEHAAIDVSQTLIELAQKATMPYKVVYRCLRLLTIKLYAG